MYGVDVVVSPHVTKEVKSRRRRSWRERLFSWPWRPWEKRKTVVERVPDLDYYMVAREGGGMMVVCHPAAMGVLQEAVATGKLTPESVNIISGG